MELSEVLLEVFQKLKKDWKVSVTGDEWLSRNIKGHMDISVKKMRDDLEFWAFLWWLT